MSVEVNLKALGLVRHSCGVGKKIGSNVYFHKDYMHLFPQVSVAVQKFKKKFPNIAYHIIRLNERTEEICFIVCPGFDTEDEPVVNQVLNLSKDVLGHYGKNSNQPVYHHKWMFVADDYAGFDVGASKQRSIAWKSIIGKDASVSSRIGYKRYWDELLTTRLKNIKNT